MFSIIVPSYNRKEEIPALLESLTKQTTYNFDVVIVDDCSKEPVEVTQSYPFAVKVIRNETNQGAAESVISGQEMPIMIGCYSLMMMIVLQMINVRN